MLPAHYMSHRPPPPPVPLPLGTTSAEKHSARYTSFRKSVALERVGVGMPGQSEPVVWPMYDFGPRTVRCPLFFLPSATGTADSFFKRAPTKAPSPPNLPHPPAAELMGLGSAGFRVIAVDYPVLWTHGSWSEAFAALLDQLRLDQVHLFGVGLGGFLAQQFAQHTASSQRVQSLILCNAFTDTAHFKSVLGAAKYRWLPAFAMKRMVLHTYFDRGRVLPEVAHAIDFLVDRLESHSRSELAARLTLCTAPAYVEPQTIAAQGIRVTIVDVLDQTYVSKAAVEEMHKCFPDAKVCHIRDGGNEPQLAGDQELNMFVRLHLRHFEGSRYSAGDDFEWGARDDGGA